MIKLSFFIKEKEHELFPQLEPLRFSVHRDHKIVWKSEDASLIIQPFSVVGRESQGYRAYFKGNPETLQYLFNNFISCFSPEISGIEYILDTSKGQHECVTIAERNRLKKGAMYSLYEHNKVMIVILPDGRITFQIRNRKIKQSELAKVLKEINSVVDIFRPQEFNLFSYLGSNSEEGATAS